MTYEGDVRDARSIARMINLAYRFGCPPTTIDAAPVTNGTRVKISFTGKPVAVTRLLAQIGKFVDDEAFA
ncbi:MAG: hypothetical protein NVSMB64_07570 [Candidatus Velthaea sp.]